MAYVSEKALERAEKKGGMSAIKARMLRAGAIETHEFCRQFDGYTERGLYAPAMIKAGLRAGLKKGVAKKLAAHYASKYEASSLYAMI